ncbi:ATP-dependent DNA helicase Q-like 4A [Paramuricea clavata]|uniref:ATP-dependent DNA helicase Q-like 4A n=1 Tax=Paramuricea clavata TaxID=317549 RepID=A0A7D9J4F4_PARCT|nr:ATP-dependent DNA helicase Q-like 4A [Paramuricea clavata]
MAVCNLTFDEIQGLPSLEDEFEYFRVLSGEKEIEVKAGSSFEAAVKMAFTLHVREGGQLDIDGRGVVITVIPPNGDEFKYRAINADPVAVELLEKNVKVSENEVNTVSTTDDPVVYTFTNASERLDFSNGSLIDTTLRNYFGFPSFRPLQKETIISTMAEKNVLTVVGTGGGKTLTYLLPAVLSSHPTLVLSPIKSLIDDTLVRCLNLNIRSCKFTGDVPHDVRKEQIHNIEDFKIIFATPECLEDGEPLRVKVDGLAGVGQLERIVFDEAHTISSWGNTFRPNYKDVCKNLCKAKCPKLLLSATVPLKVENDLREICGDFTVLRRTVYRENLYLEVVERTGKFLDQLSDFISQNKDACGIVYCVLPKDVCKIHGELLKRGINAVKYHGKLSDAVKLSSQSKWMSGEVIVIVANSSFGMGIDKANVSNCKHRGTHQITDGTSDALKVLQAVVELSNINLTCNDLKLYLAGSNQKCVSHLQEYATFGSLGKKFVPVSLLAKFLHLLIVGDILTERIHKKGTGSSISVEITLGSKAHDLLANNFMIDKYEKT